MAPRVGRAETVSDGMPRCGVQGGFVRSQRCPRCRCGSLVVLITVALVALSVSAPGPASASATTVPAGENVILRWNSTLLDAAKSGKSGPPMVARAVGVLHTCTYDAWAAYDPVAIGTRLGNSLRTPAPEWTVANKSEAISYAAYLAATDLYPASKPAFDALMARLGYDPTKRLADNDTPANIGTRACRRTSWLVGADGSRSQVRRLAGIGVETFGASCRCVNILLDADLEPLIRDRASLVYSISNPELHATVLTVDNRRRWLVNVVLPDGEQVDPTPQWCARMVRAAVGQDDLDFRVVRWQCWTATAWLAHRYRQGRILITGDAAHVCPPYGGFGMNLGLADAHNLAWKLALCVTGRAGEDLIDSYEQERSPIGKATVVESAFRLATARDDHAAGRTRRGEITGRPSEGLVLGGRYRSAAIHAVGEPPPLSVESYRPDAAPGSRAPHVWLPDGRSTLDLFGPWFTLLTGPRYRHRDALPDLMRRYWLDASGAGPYGIGDGGAVLVRPDGHVAWRATREDAQPPALRWLGAAGRAPQVNR